MADSSSSWLEPKSIRRPSPQPGDNRWSAPPPRPTSGESRIGRPGSQHEQEAIAVAGPSRMRPLSDDSVQTAFRFTGDDTKPAEERVTSRIRTPSIEHNANPPAPIESSSAHEPRSQSSRGRLSKKSSKGKERASSTEGPDELAAPLPVQRRAEDTKWRRQQYMEDQGNSADFEAGRGPIPTRGKSKKQKRSSRQVPKEGLDELAAPQPVDRDAESTGWRQEEHMEDDDATSQESALPPPSFGRRRSPSQFESDAREPSKLATQLYTYSYLVFFSFWGTLARLGVQWLTFYPGAPVVTSVLWANVGGSVVMGFLSEDRQIFREEWGGTSKGETEKQKLHDEAQAKKNHAKVKKTIPLYIGLATGFCGSFTSFSSFLRDVFLALSNNLPTPDYHPHSGIPAPSFTSTVHRDGGYSFLAVLAVMLYTVALSLAGLFVGAHIAIALDPWTPTLPFRFTRSYIDRAMLLLAPLCWLGAIFLAIWPPDRPGGSSSRGSWTNETWRGEVLFALVFTPVGCLLRYYASIKLNPISSSFPLGTFAANVFGCAIEAMLYDIQHVPLLSVGGGLVGGGRVGCQVLQGMMDGFCGCLTTVSTWVAELQGLRRRHAYVYGMASLVAGLCIMIIIMGSVRWTVGWSEPACVTMRTSM